MPRSLTIPVRVESSLEPFTPLAKPLARSRKSVKKRDAIIGAAIEVINAKSYALATMTEIAANLDLRDGTLYYYFPSKQALAYACHVRSLERFEQLLQHADRSAVLGSQKLSTLFASFLSDSERNGAQLYFGDHSYLDDFQRTHVDETAARLELEIERFLNEGMEDGSIRRCEPRLVVQLLVGMLIWLAKWTTGVKGLTVQRLMDAINVVTMDGLAVRSPGAETL